MKIRFSFAVLLSLSVGLAVSAQEKKDAAAAPAVTARHAGPAVGSVGVTMKDHVLLIPDDLKWSDAPPSLPPGAKVAVLEGDPNAAPQLDTGAVRSRSTFHGVGPWGINYVNIADDPRGAAKK